MILSIYLTFAACLYHRTFRFVFRSDEWILYNPFIDLDFSLKSIWRVIAFEMFGDIRFFPLAHLLLFAQFKLFGTRTLLYKITAIVFHALNGLMVYAILCGLGVSDHLSLLCGLLFLSLFTHFDSVTWTYHIYHVLFSTFLILVSMSLVIFSVISLHPFWGLPALVICGISMFLYEAIVPVPIFIFVYGAAGMITAEGMHHPGLWVVLMLMVSVLFYGCYGVAYILFFRKEKKVSGSVSDYMSIWDVFSFRKFREGATGLLHNIKIFLHNSGLPVMPRITDIVYLPFSLDFRQTGLERKIWITYLACVASALIHVGFSFEILKVIVLLEASAFAYIFLFIIGRNVKYAVTQPRYQYFFNAVQVLALALLICGGKEQGFKDYHLTFVLLALIGTNSLNVLKSNREIDRILKGVHDACWALRGFFSKNKHQTVYVDFSTTPSHQNGKFFLGSDIALDVLFHDNPRLIKDMAKADMILGENGIRPNTRQTSRPGDFSLSFSFLLSGNFLTKRQKVFGSPFDGICVYIEPDFHVTLENSDHIFKSSDALVKEKGWHDILIEKDQGNLIIVRNGRVIENSPWSCDKGFSSDQRSCMGDFYFGPRAPYYITDLHICTGMAKHGLRNMIPGEAFETKGETKENWWPNEWLAEINEIKQYMKDSDCPEALIPSYYYESLYKLASFTEKEGELSQALTYFRLLRKMAGKPTLKNRLVRADLFRLLPGIYYHMAMISKGLGDHPGAIETFMKCLAHEPAHKASANELFDILCLVTPDAENRVSQVLKLMKPKTVKRLVYLKIIAQLLDKESLDGFESCAGLVDQYLKHTPSFVLRDNGINLIYKTASFYKSKRQMPLAEHIFAGIIGFVNKTRLFDEKQTFASGCYFHLGQMNQNTKTEAVEYLKKCLAISPNHMKARQILSELVSDQV